MRRKLQEESTVTSGSQHRAQRWLWGKPHADMLCLWAAVLVGHQPLASAPAGCSWGRWAAACGDSVHVSTPKRSHHSCPSSHFWKSDFVVGKANLHPPPHPPQWGTALSRAGRFMPAMGIAQPAGHWSLHHPKSETSFLPAPTYPLGGAPHTRTPTMSPWHSQEEDDASVGHGIGQPQNAAAHDGIAQIEDGHPKRRLPFELFTGHNGEGMHQSHWELAPSHPHHCAHAATHISEVCLLLLSTVGQELLHLRHASLVLLKSVRGERGVKTKQRQGPSALAGISRAGRSSEDPPQVPGAPTCHLPVRGQWRQ